MAPKRGQSVEPTPERDEFMKKLVAYHEARGYDSRVLQEQQKEQQLTRMCQNHAGSRTQDWTATRRFIQPVPARCQ